MSNYQSAGCGTAVTDGTGTGGNGVVLIPNQNRQYRFTCVGHVMSTTFTLVAASAPEVQIQSTLQKTGSRELTVSWAVSDINHGGSPILGLNQHFIMIFEKRSIKPSQSHQNSQFPLNFRSKFKLFF